MALPNLKIIEFGDSGITDLEPLRGMHLKELLLYGNQIKDLSPIADMQDLELLVLAGNQISDVSALAGLKNLHVLMLVDNPIGDFTPLQDIYGQLKEKDFELTKAEVIQFSDAALERAVRREMNIPEGPITTVDAAYVGWLSLDTDPNAQESEKIQDISALRYFTGLDGVTMNGNLIRDISPLMDLHDLHQLWLLGNPLDDINQLAGFTKLVKLGFDARMQSISFIGNMPDLEELRADALRELPAELPSLTHLVVFCSLGGELSDISLLAQCPNLFAVDLSWNLVSDLTPLQNLPLTELYLQGNTINDFTPIKDIFPKLIGRNFDYIELLSPEQAGQVVVFPDPLLQTKIREAIGKPQGDITAGDLMNLVDLGFGNDWQPQIPDDIKITNLEGLQYCINLRSLSLYFHGITDISPLAGLANLENLDLGGNQISDLSPLSGLNKLRNLTLFGNRIEDLSPLSGLTSLGVLHLANNPLTGIEPLSGLTGLGSLFISSCGLYDISPVASLTNLDFLDMANNFVSDLSALSGMSKLAILKLKDNPIQDYTPVEALYPQLQEKDFELGQQFDVYVPLKPENPDAVVEIGDGALESVLRGVTGVFDRPLTQKDLAGIGKFMVEGFTPETMIYNISALKYCINLEGFIAYGSGISDLSPLRGLTKLRVLGITNAPLSDLSPLKDSRR